MVGAIMNLRVNQVRRVLNDLGLGRVIFVLFVLAGFTYQIFISMEDRPDVAVPLCVLMILVLHLKRKDLPFLKSHIEGYKIILLIEYLALSIPLLAGLIFYRHWLILMVYMGILTALIQIGRQFRKITLNTFIQNWIPDDTFEWKSGVRKSLIYLVPVYLAGVGASFWPGTVPVVMLVLSLFIIGFNQVNEPLQLLFVFEKSAKGFLWFKIYHNLVLLTIVMLPLMALYLAIHIQYWYLPVTFYLISAIILTYSVLCKYAFYRPDIETGNQVFTALGPASIFVSFLVPLILILSVRFYFKSINNLNQYLYDFD